MPPGSSSQRVDIYRTVTETIIAQIEAGAEAYWMPWHHGGSPVMRPRNAVTQTFYRGVNVLALWAAAQAAGYPSGLWATYRQWTLAKAQVRKGERGHLVVFWKRLDRPGQPYTEDDEEACQKPKQRIVGRGFWVFNIAQVDGYQPFPIPELPESERIARAEHFYAALGIETRYGGERAFYDPAQDYVQVPPFERFRGAVGFYSTLLHEGAHATSAAHRLNRDVSGRFGSEAYAFEELIAEWASAMTCMTLNLSPEPRVDHAAYISSWLRVLLSDARAVFNAASQAQKVVDWMWEKQAAAKP